MVLYRVYIHEIDEKGIVYDCSIEDLRKKFSQFFFEKEKLLGKTYYDLYKKGVDSVVVGTVEKWMTYEKRMKEMGLFPFYEDLWNKRGDI